MRTERELRSEQCVCISKRHNKIDGIVEYRCNSKCSESKYREIVGHMRRREDGNILKKALNFEFEQQNKRESEEHMEEKSERRDENRLDKRNLSN